MSQKDCPFGQHLQKYWALRYHLFSKFDDGIQVDEEGLYSAKPELSALSIGKMLGGNIVLDAFCGVGGSAIGLARAGKRVIAVDTNRERLGMAKHNATIYGVESQIEFANDDALSAISSFTFDAIYLDPPWGGPDYYKRPRFPLAGFDPNGDELLRAALSHTNDIAITAPPNFDLWEISRFRKDFCAVYDWIDGKAIYLTVFFNATQRRMMETTDHGR